MSDFNGPALSNIDLVVQDIRTKLATMDPKTIAFMQSQKINPKVLRSKGGIAHASNMTLSKSKHFGGETRARLRAKIATLYFP